MSRIAGFVVAVVVLCWSQVGYAQDVKQVTVLGSKVVSSSQGKDFSSPAVLQSTDIAADIGDGLRGFKASFVLITPSGGSGSAKGSVHVELRDKNGNVVSEATRTGNFARARVDLLSAVGVSGPGPNHNPDGGSVSWFVDEASFLTGTVRMEISGVFDDDVGVFVAVSGAALEAYRERRDMAGVWVIDIPFPVEE